MSSCCENPNKDKNTEKKNCEKNRQSGTHNCDEHAGTHSCSTSVAHSCAQPASQCCAHEDSHAGCSNHKGFDWILNGSAILILSVIITSAFAPQIPALHAFSAALVGLLSKMWWGVALGMVAVGGMQFIPREYFQTILGKGDSFQGIFRAALAGLLLDLCSHGILMIGAKLYERGASIAQIMTFLIASPWNSLSLTFILIALIGLPWTLVFIAASLVIAIITGSIFILLLRGDKIPQNPNTIEIEEGFNIVTDAKARLKAFHFNKDFVKTFMKGSVSESRMVLRWLLFGTIIAGAIQAFVPTDTLHTYFGPSLLGLVFTLVATTIIEVCSEGSAPIGAELVNRAGAPGNGFTFLMAGVSTDYTEMMVIRGFTKSWKITMLLPILTIPQVIFLGYIMNVIGAG